MDPEINTVLGQQSCWYESSVENCHQDSQDAVWTKLSKDQASIIARQFRTMPRSSTPVCQKDA